MKTAVTMISVSKMFGEGKIDLEGFIRFCGRIGVDGVDLLEYYWKDKEKEIPRVEGMLKNNNLELAAFAIGNNFTLQDEHKLSEQADYVKAGIDTARRLGTDKLRVFGGNLIPGMTRDESLGAVIEGFERCVPYAEEAGVVLALENHGGMPGRSDEIIRVIKHFNSPCLKVNIDLANFYGYMAEVPENPISAARKLMPFIVHAHVKDFARFPDGGSRLYGCILGEGIVPLEDSLKQMKEGGYSGFLSLEFEGERHYDEEYGIRRSIENLKTIVAGLKN